MLKQTKEPTHSEDQLINVIAYSNGTVVDSKPYSITILIPDINIEITKSPSNQSHGYLNLKIKSENDIILSVTDVKIDIFYHGTEEKVEFETKPMPIERLYKILEELPSEINPESFLGEITFKKYVDVDVQFTLTCEDLMENKFERKSVPILLNDKEIQAFASNPFNIPEYIQAPLVS
jgi:hypothetical protein